MRKKILLNNKTLEKLGEEILEEEWKDIYINGEKSDYKISNNGRIFSLKSNKMIIPTILYTNKNIDSGYEDVGLHMNGKIYHRLIHRLVAQSFIDNPDSENKTQVNHIDGNKQNNYYKNLEWVTQQENIDHAIRTGLINNSGEKNPNNVYTEEQIHRVCKLLEEGKKTPITMERETGVNRDTIYKIKFKGYWSDISSQYNISKFYFIKKYYPEEDIHYVCELLEDIKNTNEYISQLTGVTESMVSEISNGKRYINISSKYNIPKNRNKYGEYHHFNKFTTSQIHHVCKLLENSKNSAETISNETGVSLNTIYDIARNKIWTDISSQYNFPEKRNPKRHYDLSPKTTKIIKWFKDGFNTKEIVKKLEAEFDMPDRNKARNYINAIKFKYKLV